MQNLKIDWLVTECLSEGIQITPYDVNHIVAGDFSGYSPALIDFIHLLEE